MQKISFQSIPQHFKLLIDEISSNELKNIFSKFVFKYFPFKTINEDANSHKNSNYEEYFDFLINYLKNTKFFVYDIRKEFINQDNNDSPSEFKSNSDLYDFIICYEGECLIIANITVSFVEKLIQNLKKHQISFINISFINEKFEKIEQEAKEEIKNFCLYFIETRKNEIVKHLIRSLIGYLIRRYYYPSEYFKDDSFFIFGDQIQSEEQKINKTIIDFLRTKGKNSKEDVISFLSIINDIISCKFKKVNQNKNKIIDFKENEFIKLRDLYRSSTASFNLVIHRKSLYLFMMKKEQIENNNHEKVFCSNYSHRCLTKFYGFLKENQKTVGFIYEFQCNGKLYDYQNIDSFFTLITITRLFEVIEYLHSNFLIHRDLSPTNILINHDNLPFISDYETIRHIEKDQDFINENNITNDLSALLYSSPELDLGKNVSYPTDIYSFGLIVHFLIEKRNKWTIIYFDKSEKNKSISKCSSNIQMLYNKCVLFDQKKRLGLNEIKKILNLEFNSFDYFEKYLLKSTKNIQYSLIVEFIIEKILIQFDKESLVHCMEQIILFRNLFLNFLDEEMSLIFLNLGEYYRHGKGVKQDYLKAKEYYEKSAQLNNSYAINVLGYLYDHGLGVEQDYLKAKEYYEKAAKLNDSYAFNNLGYLYDHGLGVKQDYLKAKEYYERSAQLNNCSGLNNLGLLYENGQGVKHDYMKAIKCFKKSAELGNADAFCYLGRLYDDGLGFKQDYIKAKMYYETSAQLGNAQACNILGIMYEYGRGVKQDYSKAKEYYEKAIQLGDSNALNNLGMLYKHGRGVEQDFLKAKEYYEKASKCGSETAMCNLGLLYENGFGVAKDYLKAIKYYQKAAQMNFSEAFICLGLLYENGLGFKQDYLKAIEYYEKSAQLNNSEAFQRLAEIYFNGIYIKRNYMKAIEYYDKSAMLGNIDAFNYLGYVYELGLGVKQNYLIAKKYYEISAQYNNQYSYYKLGVFNSNGDFFDINLKLAIKYFLKAIKLQNGIIYDINSKSYINCPQSNTLSYISFNHLGLIYHILLNDEEKAEYYFKQSAFNEFPFGQNNFGLFCQFYLNNIENAKYMYEKSSKKKFSLAEYNLAYLLEKNNDIENSIQYYKRASDHEDEKFSFREYKVIDKRLEISKTFVIFLANLKLVDYYFSLKKYEESKKFFNRAINKLSAKNEKYLNPYIFQFKFQGKDIYNNPNTLFSYLRDFIFTCPLFNFLKQLNFNLLTMLNLNHQNNIIKKEKIYKTENKTNLNGIEFKEIKINDEKTIKQKHLFDDKNNKLKLIERSENLDENETKKNVFHQHFNQIETVFTEPNKLFDFIVNDSNQNMQIKSIFIKEIKDIIYIMEKIIYTPPYSILFGRMFIDKQKEMQDILNNQKENINDEFYEGFGEDLNMK